MELTMHKHECAPNMRYWPTRPGMMIMVGRSSAGTVLNSFRTQSSATSPPSDSDNISLQNSTKSTSIHSRQHTLHSIGPCGLRKDFATTIITLTHSDGADLPLIIHIVTLCKHAADHCLCPRLYAPDCRPKLLAEYWTISFQEWTHFATARDNGLLKIHTTHTHTYRLYQLARKHNTAPRN